METLFRPDMILWERNSNWTQPITHDFCIQSNFIQIKTKQEHQTQGKTIQYNGEI